MLEEITIKNFKSYSAATLKLAPLTLLVGANASGKSNLIEALRFLSWLARGRNLPDIAQNLSFADGAIRGGLHDFCFDPTVNIIKLGCVLTDGAEALAWNQFSISIQVQETTMRVVAESVESKTTGVPLYEIKPAANSSSPEVSVAYNNFARGGRKPVIPCTDRQAVFTQLDIPSRFESSKAREVIPQVSRRLQQALSQIWFLDPVPQQMTGYSFIIDNELGGNGRNVSSVLFNLCQPPGGKNAILQFIASLPEQDIIDIGFIKTPRSEVMVKLLESFGRRQTWREAPVLSDGTLRVLAVAAALLSAPEGSLVVIEEVDNGIHPSRARHLLTHIQDIAQKRKLRVLLSSHNPALLDALPTAAIPHVVACYRDPQEGDSQLVRLEDMTDYPELVARGPLGQLMTNGIVDKYLKSQRNAAEKQKQALDWLREWQKQVEKV